MADARGRGEPRERSVVEGRRRGGRRREAFTPPSRGSADRSRRGRGGLTGVGRSSLGSVRGRIRLAPSRIRRGYPRVSP
ncbi:hypothetical protein MTIV3_ORF33 [Metallosphaera turreted icosahedral virus 3]|nr:hypothetical protein MTIV3_ORF33 [Metallosphaera turreted icosahedral virus 3]